MAGTGGEIRCLDEGLGKEYTKQREEHVQRPWDRQELGVEGTLRWSQCGMQVSKGRTVSGKAGEVLGARPCWL